MRRIQINFVSIFIMAFFISQGQNISINTSGSTAHSSAIVDISSNEKGILIPRMTNGQRQAIKDPATGLIIYNTTSNQLNYYNGAGWYEILNTSVSSNSGNGTASGGSTAINTTGANADASALLDISSDEKGLLIPRTTQGAVSATEGLIIYNSTTNTIDYYNGSSWNSLCNAFIDNNKGLGATMSGVAISNSGSSPNPSAILDISSTNKGLLIPRMTSTERDAIKTPASGLIVYNTTTDRVENWDGSNWYELQNDSDAPSSPTASAASNINQTNFDANWTVVSGATTYSLDVATDAGFTSFIAGYNNKNVGNVTTENITGLTCGTTYYYRIRAGNTCGSSTNSNTQIDATSSCWSCGSSLVDARDGKSYSTVLIGSQCWMATNLNYGNYTAITSPQSYGDKFCQNLSGSNDASCPMGGLYTWDNLMQGSSGCNGTGAPPNDICATPVQGLCPTGWHIPSHYEWTTLLKAIGSSPTAFLYDETTTGWFGTNEGGNLKASTICGSAPCFDSPNTGATNSSGFLAEGSGMFWTNTFNNDGRKAEWWSSTSGGTSIAWVRGLNFARADVEVTTSNKSSNGSSVRCIRD